MSEYFSYDVFLSHSSKNKAVVRSVAARLKADGVRVWFDEWEIRAGDSIPARIEEGLEQSRVLVLFMSAEAFGSDWAALEAGTFRFRDPLNRERRFLPVRLDDAPARGSLAQFRYVDWRPGREEYERLREVCGARQAEAAKPAEMDGSVRVLSLGHTGGVNAVAFSPDGRFALSGSDDRTVRLWEVESGRAVRVMEGHSDVVSGVAFSPEGRLALSGSTSRVAEIQVDDVLTIYSPGRQESEPEQPVTGCRPGSSRGLKDGVVGLMRRVFDRGIDVFVF